MLKTVSSFLNVVGALNYKGTWDASTNNPTLTSSVGTKGDYYVVSVAGSTNLDGTTLWGVGDWAVFNGSIWQKVDGGSTGDFTTITVSGTANIATANVTNFVSGNVTISGGNATLTNVTASNVNVIYRGTSSNTGALNVGGNLSSSDIGIISSFVGNGSTYSYVAIQNTNSSNTAYASVSTINDGFSAYSDLGTNSTTYSYSAAGFPNNAVSTPNASFLVAYGGNLAVSTWSANPIHFVANSSSSTTSAMVVNGNNSVTINSLSQTASSSAAMPTSSIPLVPAGYLQFTLANATVVKIPYYGV
jgi:hypothetical protein